MHPLLNFISMMKNNKQVVSLEEKAKLQECFNKYGITKIVKKPPKSRLNANGVREITQC